MKCYICKGDKKMKKSLFLLLMTIGLLILIGCGSTYSGPTNDSGYYYDNVESGESYLEITENPFVSTLDDPLSTFSLDTSTAGYSNIRRMINENTYVPKDAVKLEEMINYFDYNYPAPIGDDALAISSEIINCPWSPNNKIISIGVKAKEIENIGDIHNNLVFLLDVSGSMSSSNKLPLMQSAFKLFVDTLGQNDTISIVTYAGNDKIALEGANGSERIRIIDAIENLNASGSTAGSKGIETAYSIAQQYFIEGGNNRVILGTDGDFNVGISSTSGLNAFISEKRDSGIYLSVLGFGSGNLQDDNLETLVNNGNGNYYYIDSINEAKKVLVEEVGGTLNVVAKDTKTQVTFNPRYVKEYRLLGYENKVITDEEFEDETADAGEIGSSHVTTAVYEVVLSDDEQVESTLDENWLKVLIKYKDPSNDANKEISKFVDETNESLTPSEDILFISGVIEMGLLLRESEFKGNSSYNSIIARIENLNCLDSDPYKAEFLELVRKLNN